MSPHAGHHRRDRGQPVGGGVSRAPDMRRDGGQGGGGGARPRAHQAQLAARQVGQCVDAAAQRAAAAAWTQRGHARAARASAGRGGCVGGAQARLGHGRVQCGRAEGAE